MIDKKFTDEYFKNKLTSEEYRVLRESGTEAAFCGLYTDTETKGMYHCKACDASLFSSNTKFHSGSGWPSFYDAVESDKVSLVEDNSHGMARTEVRCSTCNSHLGHMFDDGPPPTGQRFCINSISLEFKPIK